MVIFHSVLYVCQAPAPASRSLPDASGVRPGSPANLRPHAFPGSPGEWGNSGEQWGTGGWCGPWSSHKWCIYICMINMYIYIYIILYTWDPKGSPKRSNQVFLEDVKKMMSSPLKNPGVPLFDRRLLAAYWGWSMGITSRWSFHGYVMTIWSDDHPFLWAYGYGSIPIDTIFSGMNIHLPAILRFTRGTSFWPIAICSPCRQWGMLENWLISLNHWDFLSLVAAN